MPWQTGPTRGRASTALRIVAQGRVTHRVDLRQVADEQAALLRVATLVARESSPDELFTVVAEEAARVVHVPVVSIVAYEDDGTATECASVSDRGELFAVGTRWSLEGTNVVAAVLESRSPVRINDNTGLEGPIAESVRKAGLRSTVGIPITVGGRLWGAMVASSADFEPLPVDTEARLAGFTELVATAIANAESHRGLARLAEQQAALRRVATLVARAAPPDELFAAVIQEVGRLLQVEAAAMVRYVSPDAMTIVALWGSFADRYELGATLPLGGRNLATLIAETRRPTRIDTYDDASGDVGDYFRDAGLRSTLGAPIVVDGREAGIRSAVGAPIIVDGRLWGTIAAGSQQEQPLPLDSEARLAAFTELIATAIANAETRAELAASRVRIVTAADKARREIERDLHDGAQQHLIALGLGLRAAQAAVPPDLRELDDALAQVGQGLADVQSGLLEIARGIHPAILARGGLGPALKMLARRSPIVVELDARAHQRLPEPVEVATYYVVSEALANAAKHAQASVVHVRVEVTEHELHASIADDGVGGADLAKGSGLVGLKDRVEALGGVITVESPVGAGTSLEVQLPIAD